MAGLGDLKGVFQPWWFDGSTSSSPQPCTEWRLRAPSTEPVQATVLSRMNGAGGAGQGDTQPQHWGSFNRRGGNSRGCCPTPTAAPGPGLAGATAPRGAEHGRPSLRRGGESRPARLLPPPPPSQQRPQPLSSIQKRNVRHLQRLLLPPPGRTGPRRAKGGPAARPRRPGGSLP